MSSQSELFELCKKVYEKTGWTVGDESWDWHTTTDAKLDSMFVSPKYYTDYLLEKLPKFSPVAKDAYLTVMEKQTPKDKREDFYWTAGYFSGYGWSYTGQSDTPLKALLRLAIALHDSGALK